MKKLRYMALAAVLRLPLLAMAGITQTRSTIQTVMVEGSNDARGVNLQYLYRMEGVQLDDISGWNVNYMNLSGLTANYNKLSRPDFSNLSPITGHLRGVNTTSNISFSSNTIPYISCDDQEASGIIDGIFNRWSGGSNIVVLLYSTIYNFCSIAPSWTDRRGVDFFTTTNSPSAQALTMLRWNDHPSSNVTISPNNDALPPESNPESPRRRNSPIPMIVLYALTSTITVLLLLVIVGGAIKARRHPERYGPRTILRPRQSRARGIAMAMLETLPIVKFGDVESKEDKLESQDGGVEMVPAAGKTEDQSTAGRPEDQSAAGHAVPGSKDEKETAEPAATQPTDKMEKNLDPSRPTTLGTEDSEASRSPPSQTATDRSLTTVEAPSCSICTEDFVLGEELRVLPCDHRFHPACVDPWLLNVSGTCPLCRIDLRPPQDIAADDSVPHPTTPLHPAIALTRPIFDAHGGRLVTRSSGLEAITRASQEERIGMLRRWREERRRSLQPSREPETAENPSNTEGLVPPDRRRSRRFSQWLRTTSYYENNSGASSRSTRPSSMVVGGLEAMAPHTERRDSPLSQPGHVGSTTSEQTNSDRDARRDDTS